MKNIYEWKGLLFELDYENEENGEEIWIVKLKDSINCECANQALANLTIVNRPVNSEISQYLCGVLLTKADTKEELIKAEYESKNKLVLVDDEILKLRVLSKIHQLKEEKEEK